MKKNLFTTSVLSAHALAGFALPASAGSPDRDVYPKPQKVFVLRSVPVPAAELSPQAAEQFPALAEALHAGKVAGAGLDVLCVEPAREDNPLLREPNCLITPHIAWAPYEARVRLMRIAEDNLRAWLAGAPIHRVN